MNAHPDLPLRHHAIIHLAINKLNIHLLILFVQKWHKTSYFQDVTMDTYIKLLQEHRVSHLVCATDQAYRTEDLCKSGAKNFFSHTFSPLMGAFQYT